RADVIHSDRLQRERKQVMDDFRSGKTPILVASDIAARGIDVDDISHVINYELPRDPEVYIHRIGRTGRAGETGVAISFCDIEERLMLDEIQKLIGHNIPVIENHPYPSHVPLKREEEPKPLATGIHSNRRPGRRRRF
ncbi:MAG TPA: C-terminal helicase domain-containing protein, partial [Phycisphaerae bacterium]|nr:C-terminal helicase domain-containing protein [Phycisphaerae bacterium]